MSSRRLLACAVLVVVAACSGKGGGGGGGNAVPAAYQGTWRTPCVVNSDDTSSIHQLVAGATTYTYSITRYTAATDCTGVSTPSTQSGTLSNAGTVTVDLGATQVSALKVDVTPSGGTTEYLLMYADTAVNPDMLYLGVEDETHDGSTPAKRPLALNEDEYFVKVNSELTPLPAAYQGIWRSGCIDNGHGTEIQQVVVGATTFTVTTTRYHGAGCTGGTSISTRETGTLNNAGTVTASLGATQVTAIQVDADGGDGTDYMLLYVAATANPNRLYSGLNDAAHDGSTPAKRPVALDDSRYFQKLDPLPVAYQGTWRSGCIDNGDGTSSIQQLVLGATTYTVASASYGGASDCTGTSAPFTQSGTLSDAGTVTASLGAASVSAIQIDVTPSHESSVYTLGYVDTAADPDRLYLGLLDVVHDGLTPATRPVALNDSWYYRKVNAGLNPLPVAYQGTWRSGCIDNGDGTSFIQQLVVGATTYTITLTEYATATCTGTSSPNTDGGTLNNAGTVTANLGAAPVSAIQLDVTPSRGLSFYTLAYVNTAVDPDRLHLGLSDEGAHDGSMPERRPVALDDSFYFVKQ